MFRIIRQIVGMGRKSQCTSMKLIHTNPFVTTISLKVHRIGPKHKDQIEDYRDFEDLTDYLDYPEISSVSFNNQLYDIRKQIFINDLNHVPDLSIDSFISK